MLNREHADPLALDRQTRLSLIGHFPFDVRRLHRRAALLQHNARFARFGLNLLAFGRDLRRNGGDAGSRPLYQIPGGHLQVSVAH